MSRQHSGCGALAPLIATTMIAALASPSFAQPDHLHCYKVNDSAAKAKYVADLDALTVAPGCEISVPAKMFCVESTKSNVTPPPPGGGPSGTPAGLFACYKLKCPKATIADESVVDQFGEHTFTKMKSKFVCAPAVSAAPTTTTTTTTLPGSLPDLVISEFMADPAAVADGDGEYFEIYNAGPGPVDLQGLTVGNGSTSTTIAGSVVVAAGDYAVLAHTADSGTSGVTAAATFSFSLPNTSGTIEIRSGATLIDALSYSGTVSGRAWEVGTAFLTAAANDSEASRCLAIAAYGFGDLGTPNSAASCTPAAPTTTTLPTSLPELVISEFLADPQAQSDTGGEYIEIYNAGADPVNLQGLTLSNGSNASNIPDPLVLAPNDYAVFGRSHNAAGGAVDGTFSFGLPNTAGTIQIKSSDVVIDELSYSSTTPGTAEEVGTAFLTAAGNDPEENRCLATAMIAGGDFGTPGAAASCTP